MEFTDAVLAPFMVAEYGKDGGSVRFGDGGSGGRCTAFGVCWYYVPFTTYDRPFVASLRRVMLRVGEQTDPCRRVGVLDEGALAAGTSRAKLLAQYELAGRVLKLIAPPGEVAVLRTQWFPVSAGILSTVEGLAISQALADESLEWVVAKKSGVTFETVGRGGTSMEFEATGFDRDVYCPSFVVRAGGAEYKVSLLGVDVAGV
jgi:hypothetical protein